MQAMEVLPLAPPPPPRQMSERERLRMEEKEEDTLRELRLFLRSVTERLAQDKRFRAFSRPVDVEEVRVRGGKGGGGELEEKKRGDMTNWLLVRLCYYLGGLRCKILVLRSHGSDWDHSSQSGHGRGNYRTSHRCKSRH